LIGAVPWFVAIYAINIAQYIIALYLFGAGSIFFIAAYVMKLRDTGVTAGQFLSEKVDSYQAHQSQQRQRRYAEDQEARQESRNAYDRTRAELAARDDFYNERRERREAEREITSFGSDSAVERERSLDYGVRAPPKKKKKS